MTRETKASKSRKPPSEPVPEPIPRRGGFRNVWLTIALLLAVAGGAFGYREWKETDEHPAGAIHQSRPADQITFNKDIAPIVFKNCSECHRPGQSAPFALLSYQDVRKHAKDIATVTADRFMPPWLPEHGYGEFVGERRLSVDQIGIIQQWVTEGAPEGSASDLPPTPTWTSDWHLGKPDLILTMPEPYQLPAEGRDVYRNFVVPSSVKTARFVKGFAFRPNNPRVVHHVFIKVDSDGQARRLDEEDAGPGYGGMNSHARMPGGQLLGWLPGRMPSFSPPGLSWRLNPGDDVVFEMHMNPSGRPEKVQPSLGLYFTDQPPTNTCFKFVLTSLNIDIPPGDMEYVVADSFRLPADVDVLAVLPHAHYLAKEMKGWATLPDGTTKWLIFIKQWDFNWQGDYRYAQPVFLPKGSILSMRCTYDNSTNNIRNPNHPPKRVTYGLQTTDEMAELWFQVLPRNQADFAHLKASYQTKVAGLMRDSSLAILRRTPNDAPARVDLGFIYLRDKNMPEAERQFRMAAQAQPDYARAHYFLGLVLRQANRLIEARTEFEIALRLNPNDAKSQGNLGFICEDQGDLDGARAHFEAALRLNPEDALARDALAGLATGLDPGG